MNKKTFAWFLVILALILLGIALILLVRARRSSGGEGTTPTAVPTLIQAPTSTPVPPTSTNPPADENAAIINIIWQWTQLTDQGAATAVPNPASYTLVFREDETFTGTADCNQISGTYSTRDGFSINVRTTTSAYCGESSLDQLYIKTLGNVVAGGPDAAGGLALETGGGAQRMQFRNGGAAP